MRAAFGFVLTCSVLTPQIAGAQSFDCAKAASATEKAICDSRSLSNLDVEMATLYGVQQELPMMMGARGATQDAAKAFLSKRDACGADQSCLTNAYDARIGDLKSSLSTAMAQYCKAIELC